MVSIRPNRYENDPQPHEQQQTCRSKKSAGLSTACSSQRLPLRGPTMPSRPSSPTSNSSPPTSNHEVTWLLLETLNAHQAIFQLPISPKDDIKNLERLGLPKYISKLVVAAEKSLDLSEGHRPTRQQRAYRSKLPLQQRFELIQDRCDLIECPQHERPQLTDLQALNVLQKDGILGADYESLIVDYKNWSPDDPLPISAAIFASRAFGGLYYKLPPGVSHKEPCLPLLIPVYRGHQGRLEYSCKWETQHLFLTYDSIPS